MELTCQNPRCGRRFYCDGEPEDGELRPALCPECDARNEQLRELHSDDWDEEP